ncbi:MAG: protein-L-isoaspartate(D-aspartate) O-methyltransferase [Alphaproteobacteria bacterium]
MLDIARLRLTMELRGAGVTDARVLGAIERTRREAFVPEHLKDQAYENVALPIACGQTISQPLVVALMTQALDLGERMVVLEIGTGSGYQAAVLAQLCRRVYTIERHRELHREAVRRFAALGLNNVVARCGNGAKGWPEAAPFDRILVTCAAPVVPETLVEQLRDGGILVLPLGRQGRTQELVKITRRGEETATERLGGVRFVPLVATEEET